MMSWKTGPATDAAEVALDRLLEDHRDDDLRLVGGGDSR